MSTTSKNISRPLSKEEGFRHIEEYLRSGMRGAEYYRSQGLSEWQFYSKQPVNHVFSICHKLI